MSDAEKKLERCVDALYDVVSMLAVEIDAAGLMSEEDGKRVLRAFDKYSAAHYDLLHLEDGEES